MYQVTGFYFHKHYVIYSTKTTTGRFASMHDRTGLTDQQAQGKFHIEHSEEVDRLIKQKKDTDSKSRILQLN